MLIEPNPQPRRFSRAAIAVSVGLHAAVLGAFMWRPEPKLLQPTSSLKGNGGSGQVIALTAPGASVLTAPETRDEEERSKRFELARQKRKQKPKPAPQPEQASVANKELRPGMPGYVLGSVSSGAISDHDVRIALPVVAPDPPIVRAKLPDWVRGDVIVEVTISETGDVVQTVVLETVGFGLEQTVVETLRRWRWIPATVDGVKVASKQDVRFHFPT